MSNRKQHAEGIAGRRKIPVVPALSGEQTMRVTSLGSQPNKDAHCVRKERDGRLMAEARSGSQTAFGELYALYDKAIFNLSYSITRHQQDAEDAVQDTFLRAYAAIGEFRGEAQFSTWIYRIAINSSLMLLRKRKRRRELSIEEPMDTDGDSLPYDIGDDRPNPEQLLDQSQGYHLLLRSIDRLPRSLRMVLKQRAVHGSTLDEIGETLGLSQAAIKARSYRARLRLAKMSAFEQRFSISSGRGA